MIKLSTYEIFEGGIRMSIIHNMDRVRMLEFQCGGVTNREISL